MGHSFFYFFDHKHYVLKMIVFAVSTIKYIYIHDNLTYIILFHGTLFLFSFFSLCFFYDENTADIVEMEEMPTDPIVNSNDSPFKDCCTNYNYNIISKYLNQQKLRHRIHSNYM